MRPFTLSIAAASLAASCATAQENVTWADTLNTEITPEWSGPEHRAFDFWIGEWEANWRGKPEGAFHHQKEGSWTRQSVFPILGGKALVELAWARDNPETPSQRGFSIRYFDPARERWVMAQNWPNATGQGAAFFDQLIGDEHLGRLTMYSITRRPNAEGEIDVQHRRYNFTDVRPGVSFRWDGSNTRDEGATWYTWNIVDFLRQRDTDDLGQAGTSFPGVHEKLLCQDEPHGGFNGLEGVWTGTAEDADGNSKPARLSAGLALDGCGVLASLEEEGKTAFLGIGYLQRTEKWMIYYLDDQPGTGHKYFVADNAGAGARFIHAPDLAIKDEFAIYNHDVYFDPTDATQRLFLEEMSDNALVLHEETRDSAEHEWTKKTTYRFSR